MKLASFEAIVHALNSAEVRFIVVGGWRSMPTGICASPKTFIS
jgi:hypothetical protein